MLTANMCQIFGEVRSNQHQYCLLCFEADWAASACCLYITMLCTKFSCGYVAPEVITCYPNEAETISFIGDCLSAKCSMVIVGDVCTYYILLLLTCLWYRCSDSKLVGTFG